MNNRKNIDRSSLIEIKTVQLKKKKIEVITLDDDDEPKPSSSNQYTVEVNQNTNLEKTKKQSTSIDVRNMSLEQAKNYEILIVLLKKHPKNRKLSKHDWKMKRSMFRSEYKKRIFALSETQQEIYFLELKGILEKMKEEGGDDDDALKLGSCWNNLNKKEEIVQEPKEEPKHVGTFPKKARPPKRKRPEKNVARFNDVRKHPAEQRAPVKYQHNFPKLEIPQPIKQERLVGKPAITSQQIDHLLQQISDSSRSPSPPIQIYQQQPQQHPYTYPMLVQQQQPAQQVGPGYNLLSERWWERPLPMNDRAIAESFVRGIVNAGGMSVYEIQLKEQQERSQAREEQALKQRLEEVERQIQELDRVSGRDDERYTKSSMEEEFERREIELRKRELLLEAKEQELHRNNERLKMDRYGSNQYSNDGFNNSSSPSMPSPYSPINISMNEGKEMPQQRRHMKRRGYTSSSSSHRHHYDDVSPEGSPSRRKRTIESSHHVRSTFYDKFDAISEDEDDHGGNQFVMTIPDKIKSSGEAKHRRYTPPKDMVYVEVSDDEDHA